ncbi:MAG: methyltransferase domain-containing protein [Oxalobacteraceae bacterium]|nr:methyltransferase domain-containing protein [Oxalobacteraceae bacterium]
MDTKALKALQWKVFQNVAAAQLVPLMRIGDELGLFTQLADLGPSDNARFAKAAGIHERYSLEWLCAMCAAGYASYDSDKGQFFLSEEQEAVFAREDSTSLMIGAYDSVASLVMDEPKVRAAFKTGEAARFFKPVYKSNLVSRWLPKIPALTEKLSAGGSFADVGCGHGVSTMLIAEHFPSAEVYGFDFHGPSIEEAKRLAADAGLGERIHYDTRSAKDYTGSFDVIAFFDCLHDMGDPIGAAEHACRQLKEGGLLVLIEPFANDKLEDNFNIVGQMFYTASTMGCVPASMAQEVGLALGAQAGPAKLGMVLQQAGFSTVETVATTATNMVLCARK